MREQQILTLERGLEKGGRLLTIMGQPGVGKSRIARAVAVRERASRHRPLGRVSEGRLARVPAHPGVMTTWPRSRRPCGSSTGCRVAAPCPAVDNRLPYVQRQRNLGHLMLRRPTPRRRLASRRVDDDALAGAGVDDANVDACVRRDLLS